MANTFVFSSESVGEGHPDKVADFISDSVLDACLTIDRTSRVACETLVKSNAVVLAREVTIPQIGTRPLDSVLNPGAIVHAATPEFGSAKNDDVFHAGQAVRPTALTAQADDIAHGVDAKKALGKKSGEPGAGVQGLMFGYACDLTPRLLTTPVMFAPRL